ncbi:MAG TPA: helix-turn-helix transcriptional regulator [Spirillospora sp.]|nr:helix-turn-helix transcriptional regulator [Spirillospora sp.]
MKRCLSRRREMRMSQERLAAEMRERGHASYRQTTVAKLEAGQRPLSLNEAVSLSELFGVPLVPSGQAVEELAALKARERALLTGLESLVELYREGR